MSASTLFRQPLGDRGAVSEEVRWLLDQGFTNFVDSSEPESALVSKDTLHSRLRHDVLHAVELPSGGVSRVLKQKVTARIHLHLDELKGEFNVSDGPIQFGLVIFRLHPEFGQMHDGRQVGAHRATNEELRLGSVQQVPRTLANFRQVEIPGSSILILSEDVQRPSTAETSSSSNRNHAGRTVDLPHGRSSLAF